MSNFKKCYFSSQGKLSKTEYNKLSLKWYILFFINFLSIDFLTIVLFLNKEKSYFLILMVIITLIQIIIFFTLAYSGYCLNRKRANDLGYKSIFTNVLDLIKKEGK